jgi:DNA mismatch repair protein MutL
VAGLFYNTPARRKFLKTVNTEMGHIGDMVAGMAMGHPQVHFKLTHNGKTVKQWLRADDPGQRAADVLGQPAKGDLIHLTSGQGDIQLSGFLGPSALARSTARGIYLYVNGRRVRDRVVQHALVEGYRGRLMKGRFPLAVLFLELPFDQVDVNVHPTKHEIRFADQRRIHTLVQHQVARALANAEARRWGVPTPEAADIPAPEPSRVSQPLPTYRIDPPAPLREEETAPQPFVYQNRAPAAESEILPPAPDTMASRQTSAPVEALKRPVARENQQPLWDHNRFADLTVIGQFYGTYIICQGSAGLVLIDQHAAHERIVYETLGRKAGHSASQRLLVPETVELGFAEAQALAPLMPELDRMGLEITPFGGNTVAVKAVPVLLDHRNIQGIVTELAEKAVEIGVGGSLEPVLDQCRMVMACHHALRANQGLAAEQVAAMLSQLDECEDPDHCPHGRPTWIVWTVRDLEKAFKRIS